MAEPGARPRRTIGANDKHKALAFEHADVGYRGRTVLGDVDLTLNQGQTLALVGPNGAGKSTLIRATLGLAQVLGGSVDVLGGPPARARGRAAYVPQLDTLDPDFPISAGRVVLMGRYRAARWWRRTSREDRRIAADALDRVGLAGSARTRFGELSGGQRQRVLVARALAARPSLLLLDEPFNGVDATSQDAIRNVLTDLTREGTAIVVSTHDLGLARETADLVCLLNGRQFAVGTPDGVLTAERLREVYAGQAVDLPDGRTVIVEA